MLRCRDREKTENDLEQSSVSVCKIVCPHSVTNIFIIFDYNVFSRSFGSLVTNPSNQGWCGQSEIAPCLMITSGSDVAPGPMSVENGNHYTGHQSVTSSSSVVT